MKTKMMITAIIAFFAIATTSLLNAQSKSQKFAGKEDTGDPICYTIQITNPGVLSGDKTRWLVCMKDGFGRLVAPAQVFIAGKNWYNFYEKGPVRGTRTAQMVCASENTGSWSSISSRSGIWYPSTCYLFILTLRPEAEPIGINKD